MDRPKTSKLELARFLVRGEREQGPFLMTEAGAFDGLQPKSTGKASSELSSFDDSSFDAARFEPVHEKARRFVCFCLFRADWIGPGTWGGTGLV